LLVDVETLAFAMLGLLVGRIVLGDLHSGVVVTHESWSGHMLGHVKIEFLEPDQMPSRPTKRHKFRVTSTCGH
jgi:hypothetical protein